MAGRQAQAKAATPYALGDIYAFRIEPLNVFPPYETRRFGVLKILAVEDDRTIWTLLDGVFALPPLLAHAGALPLIVENEYDWSRRYATHSTPHAWENDLRDFALVGQVPLSDVERVSAKGANGATAWGTASHVVEHLWWSRNNSSALKAALDRAQREFASRPPTGRPSIAKHDWAALTEPMKLPDWQSYPPAAFASTVRSAVAATAETIKALGPAATENDVRQELERCILVVNRADEDAGSVIETEEREDILLVLLGIAEAAGHSAAFDTACAQIAW